MYYYATEEKEDTFFRQHGALAFTISIRQRQIFGDWCDGFPTGSAKEAHDVPTKDKEPAIQPPKGETWESIENAKQPSSVAAWKEEGLVRYPLRMPARKDWERMKALPGEIKRSVLETKQSVVEMPQRVRSLVVALKRKEDGNQQPETIKMDSLVPREQRTEKASENNMPQHNEA